MSRHLGENVRHAARFYRKSDLGRFNSSQGSTDNLAMSGPSTRSKRNQPGLRALSRCGDGFWECDLIDGSAWFSDWFYRRLGWSIEVRRAALHELKSALAPEDWELFMRRFRAHLEQAQPFNLCLPVTVAGGQREWWQFKGSAGRTDAGLPLYMAGSARELVSGDTRHAACPCGAFDALPVAAALLDAGGTVLHTNPRWNTLSPGPAAVLKRQIQGAGGTAAIVITVESSGDEAVGKQPLTAHARRYEWAGNQLWVAVIDER